MIKQALIDGHELLEQHDEMMARVPGVVITKEQGSAIYSCELKASLGKVRPT